MICRFLFYKLKNTQLHLSHLTSVTNSNIKLKKTYLVPLFQTTNDPINGQTKVKKKFMSSIKYVRPSVRLSLAGSIPIHIHDRGYIEIDFFKHFFFSSQGLATNVYTFDMSCF